MSMPRKCNCGKCPLCLHRERMRRYYERHPEKVKEKADRQKSKSRTVGKRHGAMDEQALKWLQDKGYR